MTFPVLPIRAIHGKNPATGGLRDFRKNEASNREVGQGAQEEEILEPSVATFIFRTREVFGGKNGEVHGPVSKNGRDDQSEAFQSGEMEIEEGIESVEKRVIKHPNFGRPTRSASFLLRLITVSQRFRQIFLSCSVRRLRKLTFGNSSEMGGLSWGVKLQMSKSHPSKPKDGDELAAPTYRI